MCVDKDGVTSKGVKCQKAKNRPHFYMQITQTGIKTAYSPEDGGTSAPSSSRKPELIVSEIEMLGLS